MTSLFTERFGRPASARDGRARAGAVERVAEVLAGRTVWCAASLPRARGAADGLRARLQGAGAGGGAATMQIEAEDGLKTIAESFQDMLDGDPAARPSIGDAERDAFAEGVTRCEQLLGERVAAEDVFVAHDALSAIAVQPARERGAHAVWRVRIAARSEGPTLEALEFLARFTPGIDAYLLTWQGRGPRGEPLERVAAALPSPAQLAITEFPAQRGGEEPRGLAWRMALAEIVRSDRGECVGGTLRPRPVVAPR